MGDTLVLTLLASLRLGPVLVGAPPFSQVRVPLLARVCLVLALALPMASRHAGVAPLEEATFLVAAACELLLGLAIAFGLQAAFASLAYAGRIVDVQAGYSLALVIDPATRAQVPMFGSIFTLVGGAVFLAHDGHFELLRLIERLGAAWPLGQVHRFGDPQRLIAFFAMVMGMGLSLVGGTVVVLWLVDLAVAVLSRTLPQMNALMLGFQVKAFVTLLMLALTAPLMASVMLRLIALSFDYIAALPGP